MVVTKRLQHPQWQFIKEKEVEPNTREKMVYTGNNANPLTIFSINVEPSCHPPTENRFVI
jgi:hypothetical protein